MYPHFTARFVPLLACLCILLGTPLYTAHAQTYAVDQGSVLIGGRASFTSVATDRNGASYNDRINQLVLNPTGQYVIIPGLAVGGDVLFSYASDDGSAITQYGMGPTVTYFFGRGARSYYPFISGSVGVTHLNRGDRDEGQTQTRYRGSGGVLVMLSQSVGVTGELFYQRTDTERLQRSTFGLAFGISAFLL